MKRNTFAALVALSVTFFASGAQSAPDMHSVVRGGRLYDNLSLELKIRTPNQFNPVFKTQQVRASMPDTWRCVQCHGWDYKGVNGFSGINGKAKADPAAIVAILKDANHKGFDDLLDEVDRVDLANFVAYGQNDMAKLLDLSTRSKKDLGASEKVFATVCANCHGLSGDKLRDIPPLGDNARQHPVQSMHTLINGHPGGEMPALRTLNEDTVAKMLAYMQTLPTVNLPGSIANGGRLFDDWQVQTGRIQAISNPTYPKTSYYFNVPSETWRCKECHGWDYKGDKGQNAKGNHFTGIKGLREMAGADPQKIVGILRSSVHLFGNVMKYRDLLDLANFVSYGQVDMDKIIDPRTGLARGDAVQGTAHYRTMCIACHGADGHFVAKRTLGRIAKDEPWHAVHTIMNGHPDDYMPALRELDPKVISDILAYTQTLPTKR